LNYNDNFGDIYQNLEDKIIQCTEKTIPKTKSKNKSHVSRPLWWNEECREMKNKLNGAQRAIRKRNTPDNLKLLTELENKIDEIRTTAQENWSENLCREINEAKSIKERWTNYRKATARERHQLILPLIDRNGNILFEEKEKKPRTTEKIFRGQAFP
jgi:hypothetical protein